MCPPTKENALFLIPMDTEGKQMREQDQMPSQSLQRAQNPAPSPALKGLQAGIGRLWLMVGTGH